MSAANGIARVTLTPLGGAAQAIAVRAESSETTVWIESRWFDLEWPFDKHLDHVIAEITEAADQDNIEIELDYCARMKGPVTTVGPLAVSESDKAIFFRAGEARFWRFRLYDRAPSALWKFSSIEFWGNRVGGRQ